MKLLKTAIFSFILFFTQNIFAQNELQIKVLDSLTKEELPFIAVKVEGSRITGQTDINGIISFKNLNDSSYKITFTYIGYFTKTIHFDLPVKGTQTVLMIEAERQLLEEITINTTRTNSHIEDIPLKIEVIGEDDTQEENGIKPGNVSSLLGDVSGIQIQQTSATSGNSNVRIQGLGGKYTQLLRDGIPMFDGFSADFGVMQLPPVDLKQIEIVKGSASTLYGGGAIAGLINLITKEPTLEREGSATLNYSSLTEKNFNTYFSHRIQKRGYTFFAGSTNQDAVDVDKDGFSDVARMSYVTLHPKLFYYFNNKTKLVLGLSGIYEKRMGGDMMVLKDKADTSHQFFESNETFRNSADVNFSSIRENKNVWNFKAAAGRFDRKESTNTYDFSGLQYNLFSELTYLIPRKKYDLVLGTNFVADEFRSGTTRSLIQNFNNITVGAFIQHTLRVKEKLILESGLRVDQHNGHGTKVLPRIAILYKLNKIFSMRLNCGLGYKTPNPFAKQFEEYDPNKINPISDSVKTEHSIGAGYEFILKKVFENGLMIYLDQSFFYTAVDKPIIPIKNSHDEIYFVNASKPITSVGSDTYLRIAKDPFEIYFGYTFTHAQQLYDTIITTMPLFPKERFATVLSYNLDKKWRFGAESSYFGSQYTPAGDKKPGYLFMALMAARRIGNIDIVLNCENVLDYRQNKVEQVVFPPYSNPRFKTLWAPIDGRVINLSARVKF